MLLKASSIFHDSFCIPPSDTKINSSDKTFRLKDYIMYDDNKKRNNSSIVLCFT